MVRFVSIMLKISILDMNLGGYVGYWKSEVFIDAGINYKIKVVGHVPWAKDVMPLTRFKQIRAAFRPELGTTLVKDKCHQLRYVINRFNDRSKKTFVPGYTLSFDEGGHATRSRLCPSSVQQRQA